MRHADDDDAEVYAFLRALEPPNQADDEETGRRTREAIAYASSGGYATRTSYDPSRNKRSPTRPELVEAVKAMAYACAMINAHAVSSLKLRLYVTTSPGERKARLERAEVGNNAVRYLKALGHTRSLHRAATIEEVVAHPILDALKTPNPFFDESAFIAYLTLCLDCVGSAYVAPTRIDPTWSPVELWPLQAQHVHPIKGLGREILSHYQFMHQRFEPDEMVRVRTLSLRDPYLGDHAPLAACFDQCGIGEAYTDVVEGILKSGARPSYIVSPSNPDRPLNDAEAKRVELDINNRTATSQGKVYVVGKGLNVNQLSMNPVDIGGEKISRTARLITANCFDVPLAMIDPEDSNRSTAGEATHSHQRLGVEPRARRIAAGLSAGIARTVSPRLFLAFDDPVQRDRLTEAKVFTMLYASDAVTPNEFRADTGRDPLPGGDRVKSQIRPAKVDPDRHEDDEREDDEPTETDEAQP